MKGKSRKSKADPQQPAATLNATRLELQGDGVPESLVIEYWPVDRPIPYPQNARKLSDRAVDKLAASIREFGFRQPIVCDKNDVIVVGHTRQLAAMKLGLAREEDGRTFEEVKAARAAAEVKAA